MTNLWYNCHQRLPYIHSFVSNSTASLYSKSKEFIVALLPKILQLPSTAHKVCLASYSQNNIPKRPVSPCYYLCQVFTMTLHRLWNEVQTPDRDILTKNVNPPSYSDKSVPITVPQTLYAHSHLNCAFTHTIFPISSWKANPAHPHTFSLHNICFWSLLCIQ